MASAVSHAVAALGIGGCCYRRGLPRRVWVTAAVAAAAPDVDIIGFSFGVPYGALHGHRGVTHSLCFAAVAAAVLACSSLGSDRLRRRRGWLWLYLFLAIASHGVLDACTNGGLGVAFFSPFSSRRYFLPWRPIEVSPLSIRAFWSARGAAVLRSELSWIWLPAGALALLAAAVRRWRRAGRLQVPAG